MTSGRLLTGWLIMTLATSPVTAAPFHSPPLLIAQGDHAGNDGISLDQAVSQVRQHYGGKVLSADTTRVDGRKVYRIKVLTKDGRVKRTQIDAGTGQTMSRGH